MQYYFWEKFIIDLFMLPNIFLWDHHCKTSFRNIWNPRKCPNSLMFLQGAQGLSFWTVFIAKDQNVLDKQFTNVFYVLSQYILCTLV